MNILDHYANETEAQWRLITCLQSLIQSLPGPATDPVSTTLADPPPESSLHNQTSELVARIARVVRSAEARLCFIDGGGFISGCYPSDLLPHEGLDLPETVIFQKQLRLPIVVQGTAVGSLDLQKPYGGGGFGTVHRQFAEAVVRLIGQRLAYKKAQESQDEFYRSLYLHRKLDSMLLTIWSLTENPELQLTEMADAVVQAVTGGLRGTTAVIAFWDEKGTMQHLAANAPSCSLSAELEQLAHERARQYAQPHSMPFEHITRQMPPSDTACPDSCRAQSTTEIMALELTRLASGRGVLAVARSGPDASFSTSEKHSLCLAASLISPSGGPASHSPTAQHQPAEAEPESNVLVRKQRKAASRDR